MQYMGSKNRISKYIVPIIQSYIDNMDNCKGLLVPFCGGANIEDKIKCSNIISCDNHEYLIELLKHVQQTTDDIPLHITEEEYYKVRDNKVNYPKWYVGLVGFTATFANKWFDGCARNKTKSTKDYSAEAIRNIIKQSPNLKGIDFRCCDFRDIPKDKIKEYVIYCDIPYKGTKQYSTSKNFPYEEFYEWCKEMSKDNIVLISEYNMPDDFTCIWQKETTTQINSKRQANDDKNIRVEKLYIYNN